jgi:hypothetical protein
LKAFNHIILVLLFSACAGVDTPERSDIRVVAVAGTEELDIDTYRENYISAGIIKDSAYNARKSIESWATESLLYQEANDKLSSDELQIEKEVEAYRKTLVNFIYQTKLLEANLDTVITGEEVEEYYESHRASFILKENILKVNYIKVPLAAPGLDKIRKLAGTGNTKEQEQLKVLCIQNAENFFINDSTWLFLDDIEKEIPVLKDEPDFNLSAGRILEFSDDSYYYYLKVKDVKVKNGLSPLNFERQNIRKFIINQRKAQLISQYKKMLLEKAKAEKRFLIY